jgi:hypothetical protein
MFWVFTHVHILQRVHNERRGQLAPVGHIVSRLITQRPVNGGFADVTPAFQAVYLGFRGKKLRLVPYCDVPSASFLVCHTCTADSTRFQRKLACGSAVPGTKLQR